jgi:adenylate kinase family enzyme
MSIRESVIAGVAEAALCPACSKLTPYIVNQEEWHQKRCGLKTSANFKRIHIIGGPGSGKTTLARKIGSCLGIETYELDQIAFTGRDFAERPFPDRVADISRIASRPAWVTEGLFVLWTEELLESANIIVWLDHVTWERSMWRIARRFVRSAVHEAKKRQGLQKFTRFQDYARHVKQFIHVVFSSRAYYTGRASQPNNRIESRSSTATFLTAYQDKVIHCQSEEAVEAFVDYIRLCHEKCG